MHQNNNSSLKRLWEIRQEAIEVTHQMWRPCLTLHTARISGPYRAASLA